MSLIASIIWESLFSYLWSSFYTQKPLAVFIEIFSYFLFHLANFMINLPYLSLCCPYTITRQRVLHVLGVWLLFDHSSVGGPHTAWYDVWISPGTSSQRSGTKYPCCIWSGCCGCANVGVLSSAREGSRGFGLGTPASSMNHEKGDCCSWTTMPCQKRWRQIQWKLLKNCPTNSILPIRPFIVICRTLDKLILIKNCSLLIHFFFYSLTFYKILI